MAQHPQAPTASQVEPLLITRDFAAPRELVFQAWSSAAHIKRWFSPKTYNVPAADIDFRPGGVFNICMRSPQRQDSQARGHFLEIVAPERLSFTMDVAIDGAVRFTARTAVTFEAHGGGTRMTVRQEYDIHDAAFIAAPSGAPEGWRTTLDKLEAEIHAMLSTSARSCTHGRFSLRREFDATPAQLFHALTDVDAKARWFGGGANFSALERRADIRPGGSERVKGRWAAGFTTCFDAVYFDVIENRRLVYSYEMHIDDRKISVSLATVELQQSGAGTALTVTEQGVFLDGYDDGGAREHGTGELLESLAASLPVA